MVALFEVETRNRVAKGFGMTRIMGTQGNWYPEKRYLLAESEAEAEQFARAELADRRPLGISARRRRGPALPL